MGHDSPPRPRDVPAGYDEEDPYHGVDLDEYPEWWRRNVEQFRDHGLRPYRPPRFADGEHTPPVLERLEHKFGVDVLFRAVDPSVGDDWRVVVDGEDVATVGRHRSGDGYTVYEVSTAAFKSIVADHVG
jgi:hypothetical protein